MALLSRFSWREKFLSTLDMGGSILAGSVKVNSSRPFVFFFFSLFFLLEFISKRTASQSQPWYSKRYYVATPVSRPPYIMRCARVYLSTYIPRFKGVLRVFLINFHRKKLEVLEIFVFALKEKKKKERKKTNFFVNIFIERRIIIQLRIFFSCRIVAPIRDSFLFLYIRTNTNFENRNRFDDHY